MKKFFAFSGGVESRTMALMFGHSAKGIFADTGWEHQALYDELDEVERKLKNWHGQNFEIIRVTHKESTLPEYIKKYKYFPSFNNRFCTRRFKIEPIDEFLKDQGECELMIGLNADETDRIGNLAKLKNVIYSYPLIDYGMTREKCESLLKEMDLMPHFPVYMRRGGCKGCFFKSKYEFKALALLNPKEAYEIADLEDSIQDARKEHYSLRDCIPNMRKFIDNATKTELSLFELDELYKQNEYSHSPCGIFCHR